MPIHRRCSNPSRSSDHNSFYTTQCFIHKEVESYKNGKVQDARQSHKDYE